MRRTSVDHLSNYDDSEVAASVLPQAVVQPSSPPRSPPTERGRQGTAGRRKSLVVLKVSSVDLKAVDEAVAATEECYATVLEDMEEPKAAAAAPAAPAAPAAVAALQRAPDKHSEAHARKTQRRSVVGPPMSFTVTKINQRGRRQQRVLRLSQVGIENVRGDVTSSIFEYVSVQRMVLNSVAQFSIYYASGKHPYVYLSPVAIQIISEVTRRVNAARNRVSVARQNFGDVAYQETLRLSLADLVGRTRGERARQLAQSPQVAAAALAALSPQERVVLVVWTALNGARSDTRRALYRFVTEQTQAAATPEGLALLAHNVRTFLDGLKYHFLQTRQREFEMAAAGEASMEREGMIRRAVEVTLESALIPMLLPQLSHRFLAVNASRDAQFLVASERLALCSQQQLHVPPQFCTANGYARSGLALSELEKELLPSEVLDVILQTVHTMYDEAAEKQAGVMAGDDFLPVFIFVILKARLQHPFARAQFALELSDPEDLQGEAGYFLTVFESALMWICDQREL